MNTRRVAAIYRERAALLARLVQLDEELAAAFVEDGDAANDGGAKPAPKTNKKAPPLVRVPDGPEPTSIQRAQAAAALRRLGYRR